MARVQATRHAAAHQALEVFSQHCLQRGHVHHLLNQKLLSLAFSASSAFSFLASETSMPPNLARYV